MLQLAECEWLFAIGFYIKKWFVFTVLKFLRSLVEYIYQPLSFFSFLWFFSTEFKLQHSKIFQWGLLVINMLVAQAKNYFISFGDSWAKPIVKLSWVKEIPSWFASDLFNPF